MIATSKQYPAAGVGVKTLGAEPTDNTIGVKQSPVDSTIIASINAAPWSDLKFKLTSPFYKNHILKLQLAQA